MKITIGSILSGKASGYLVVNAYPKTTVESLLSLFCKEKGISVADNYILQSQDNVKLSKHKNLQQSNVKSGDVLLLSYEDEFNHINAFGTWWILALSAFLLGAFGLVCINVVYFKSQSSNSQYGIVIDAGSTHCEAFLFVWDGHHSQTSDVHLIDKCYVPDGLTLFLDHPDSIPKHIGPCIKKLRSHIPESEQEETQAFVGATGGMRMLRDFDSDGASAILSAIKNYFAYNMSFVTSDSHVEILSGHSEGISGWIAANYILGTLKKPTKKTVSTLDVGGASVQITIPIQSQDINCTTLTLFNRTHKVFTKTFLCYGITEAQNRYEYLLMKEYKSKNQIKTSNKTQTHFISNPCLPKGATNEVEDEELKVPCTLTRKSHSEIFINQNKISAKKLLKFQHKYEMQKFNEEGILGRNFTCFPMQLLNHSSSNEVYIYNGTSEPKACEKAIHSLFDAEKCKNTFLYGDCFVRSSIPHFQHHLNAFSDVFHILRTYLGLEGRVSLQNYYAAIRRICSMSLIEINEMFDNSSDFMDGICFDSMYVYKLLTEGLGVTSESWMQISFDNRVHNKSIDWAVGFMLNETNHSSSPKNEDSLSVFVFLVLFVIFVSFILLSLYFFVHSYSNSRCKCNTF